MNEKSWHEESHISLILLYLVQLLHFLVLPFQRRTAL